MRGQAMGKGERPPQPINRSKKRKKRDRKARERQKRNRRRDDRKRRY